MEAARAAINAIANPSNPEIGERVENVEDVLGVGQKIQVEISKIDDRGKLSLVPVVDETPERVVRGASLG